MLINALFRRATSVALTSGALLLASALAVQTAGAQSVVGKWEGTLFAQGNSIPVVITFDSTDKGWSGTLLVAQLRPDPITMASVSVKKDTVTIQLPEDGMSAFFQGLLSADRKTLNGMIAVAGDNSGTFQVTKTAAPAKPPTPPPPAPAPTKPPYSERFSFGRLFQ